MAVTDWKTCGTGASADRDEKNAWTLPARITADDDSTTYCSNIPAGDYGDWLRGTNFGFADGDIPVDSTIDGVEFKFEARGSAADDIKDSALYLRTSAGQVGDNKADATAYSNSLTWYTRGGAADLWGATLAQTDIVSSNFGFDLSCANIDGADARSAYVDVFQCRVYYTAPSTGQPTMKRKGGIPFAAINRGVW